MYWIEKPLKCLSISLTFSRYFIKTGFLALLSLNVFLNEFSIRLYDEGLLTELSSSSMLAIEPHIQLCCCRVDIIPEIEPSGVS
jgi:hypothetical protein